MIAIANDSCQADNLEATPTRPRSALKVRSLPHASPPQKQVGAQRTAKDRHRAQGKGKPLVNSMMPQDLAKNGVNRHRRSRGRARHTCDLPSQSLPRSSALPVLQERRALQGELPPQGLLLRLRPARSQAGRLPCSRMQRACRRTCTAGFSACTAFVAERACCGARPGRYVWTSTARISKPPRCCAQAGPAISVQAR